MMDFNCFIPFLLCYSFPPIPKLVFNMGRRWISRSHRHNDDTCGMGVTKTFSYKSLQIATKNFSKDMLIGQGGTGKVYKGTLSNGTAIAVKVCPKESYLQWGRLEEFVHTVEVMSRIRHQNIVQVIGGCLHKDTLLIVGHYVPNGSLTDLLVDPVKKKSSVFNWRSRAAICIGIARGLSYLHTDATPSIIHLDIKPENILFDHNFIPKIIDFEGCKFFDESKESWTYEALVSGTYGYIDPNFIKTGKYSSKSDVFAFGVVILEIICGRRGIGRSSIVVGKLPMFIHTTSKLVADGKYLEIIDPVLTDAATDEVQSFIDVAFLCIQDDPKRRPGMLEVWQMLYGACNSSSLLYRRPDMSMVASFHCWQEEEEYEEQQHSTSVIVLNLTRNLNADAKDTTNEGRSSICQSEEHTIGVNLLSLTCTTNPLEGQSSISPNSTAETSTTQESLHSSMAFKKHSAKYDFPEAVYPPFLTSVHHRRGLVGFHGSYTRSFFP